VQIIEKLNNETIIESTETANMLKKEKYVKQIEQIGKYQAIIL
jgi:hypothetical protein